MTGTITQGTRRDNLSNDIPALGEYGKGSDGHWYGCSPHPPDSYGFPFVAKLSQHQVVEHEDGTISVSPSILITGHNGQWHGYLQNGVWREV